MSNDKRRHQAAMLLHRVAETRPILSAPCVFCGYNGEGYYQRDTHAKECPWRHVGGASERDSALRFVIHSLAVEVSKDTETYCDSCDDPKSLHRADAVACSVEDCMCSGFREAEPPLVKPRG